MRNLILSLLVIVLGGCALKIGGTDELEVVKSSPVVYVYPLSNEYQDARVGILPFLVPGNLKEEQGRGVAALFKDIMLGKRAFREIQLLPRPYGDLQDAVAAGKTAGVDLVLAGKINYLLGSSELGGARVDVSVRMLNVRTGNTVWYIEQVMDQPVDYPDVSFTNRLKEALVMPQTRPPNSAPAAPNMLMRIAMDMTDVMGGATSVRR